MMDGKLVGKWTLIAATRVSNEIEFVGEEPDPHGVGTWLNGTAAALPVGSEAASGLTLRIAEDGAFVDVPTGHSKVEWFDAEGVLVAEPTPMQGRIAISGDAAYLQVSDVNSWAKPVEGRYAPAILRYDDGDTKIADSVRPTAAGLVRTVNVVTDELYLTRTILLYRRSGAE